MDVWNGERLKKKNLKNSLPRAYEWDQGYFQQEIYRRISAGLAENQN